MVDAVDERCITKQWWVQFGYRRGTGTAQDHQWHTHRRSCACTVNADDAAISMVRQLPEFKPEPVECELN